MIQQHTYHFPTDIRFGPGVIKELPDYLKQHKLSRPFVVTDPVVKGLEHFQGIIEQLKANQFEHYKKTKKKLILLYKTKFFVEQCSFPIGKLHFSIDILFF